MIGRPRRENRKIAWLSPFGPRSDIGAHSAAVVRALHRHAADYGCEVALFAQRNGPTYPSATPRIMLESGFSGDVLSLVDILVLNIGNNGKNNLHINELAISRGGVIVVHDVSLHAFVATQLLWGSSRANRYVDILCRYYGDAAIEVLEGSGVTYDKRIARFDAMHAKAALALPLIEPFLERAEAIVVHSQFASDFVSSLCNAPQLRLFLPFDKKAPPEKQQPTLDGRVRFCCLGHIHRSKQIQICIEAFAASDRLRKTASLRIAGGAVDSDYIRELIDLARTRNLLDAVRFELNVSERRLREIKATTDVFLNVRFPNSEGASGSLAEQMACGLPTIVLDTGSFHEIPDGAVYKIADIGSPATLRTAMETLASDPELRKRIGESALNFGQTRTADEYARRFLDFLAVRAPMSNFPGAEVGGSVSPFAWLRRRVDGAWSAFEVGPRLLEPNGAPMFRAVAGFDAPTLVKYLALAFARQKPSAHALSTATAILTAISAERAPSLVSRLAFLLRSVEAEKPVPLWSSVTLRDAEAMAILWLFDPDVYVRLVSLVLLGRATTQIEIADLLTLRASAGAIWRGYLHSEEAKLGAPPAWLADMWAALPAILDALTAAPPEAPRRLKLGETLAEAALAEALRPEWRVERGGGVSSLATEAKFRFLLDPEDRRENAMVKLKLHVSLLEAGVPDVLALLCHGSTIAEISIDSEEPFVVEIPLEEFPGDEIALTLKAGSSTSPLRVFLYELALDADDI